MRLPSVVLGAATVSKMIKEMLPNDIRCANDTRDLILDCCVGTLLLCLSHQLRGSEPACAEFIHLISSEANEMCNKESKKTIGGEHVMKALEAQPLTLGNGQQEQRVTSSGSVVTMTRVFCRTLGLASICRKRRKSWTNTRTKST